MRRINKLTSLMLAMIMMVSFMMPSGVYEVFAGQGDFSIKGVEVPSNILKKGDKFNVSIDIASDTLLAKNFEEDELSKASIAVYLDGVASGVNAKSTISSNRYGATITMTNVEYNGSGNELNIEVHYEE
ncbi:MAG: hypothetical protein RR324_02840, partial [Cellulosilyticaceae bacterium]